MDFSVKFQDILNKIANNGNDQTDHTSNVPNEVIQRIFLSLSFRDMGQCVLVSRRWCALMDDINLWNTLIARIGLPPFRDTFECSLVSKKDIAQTPLLDWNQPIKTKEELCAFLENFHRVMQPNQLYRIEFKADENSSLHVYVQKGGMPRRVYIAEIHNGEYKAPIIHCLKMLEKPSELLTPLMVTNPNGTKWNAGPGIISSNDWIEKTGSFYGYEFKGNDQFCYDLSSSIEKVLKKNANEYKPNKLKNTFSSIIKLFQ